MLLSRHGRWLRGRRVGLLSHLAAVDPQGCSTADRLRADARLRLAWLAGPEHGFMGAAVAGAACVDRRESPWGVPVYSLYGETRAPTPAMLRAIDTLVIDLQDLGARPYTYVSTLQLALQACAAAGREVVVADRPVPLPNTVDGPLTEDACRSFVSLADLPLSYGMTPGETAAWLKRTLGLDLELHVAPMAGYGRQPWRGAGWPPWRPPSPAMRSWESAQCLPATVCLEAIGVVDHARATNMPFQFVGGAGLDAAALCEGLTGRGLPGVRFYAESYEPRPSSGLFVPGVRMCVMAPDVTRPALTALCIVAGLQDVLGVRRVWRRPAARPEFFDKLFGTASVRVGLARGDDPRAIAAAWRNPLRAFRCEREKCLLYERAREVVE